MLYQYRTFGLFAGETKSLQRQRSKVDRKKIEKIGSICVVLRHIDGSFFSSNEPINTSTWEEIRDLEIEQ